MSEFTLREIEAAQRRARKWDGRARHPDSLPSRIQLLLESYPEREFSRRVLGELFFPNRQDKRSARIRAAVKWLVDNDFIEETRPFHYRAVCREEEKSLAAGGEA